MQLDYRYMRDFLDEDGTLKVEINFVDYLMTAISDSGKFHAVTNPCNTYETIPMISFDDLKYELSKIFRKEEK